MTARETVLGNIRDALTLSGASESATRSGAAGPVPREYRTGRTMPDRERLELLEDRLVDYKAEVHTCEAAATAETIAEVLRSHGARRIGVPAGLDRDWLATYDGTVEEDEPGRSPRDLERLDGVVTSSEVSCAETGTIFLNGAADQGRRALTLVPDLHVCVVDMSTVEVGVPEALARVVPERPTTLISGPSATSDIELERVEGVHGPRTLVVVIRTDA